MTVYDSFDIFLNTIKAKKKIGWVYQFGPPGAGFVCLPGLPNKKKLQKKKSLLISIIIKKYITFPLILYEYMYNRIDRDRISLSDTWAFNPSLSFPSRFLELFRYLNFLFSSNYFQIWTGALSRQTYEI